MINQSFESNRIAHEMVTAARNQLLNSKNEKNDKKIVEELVKQIMSNFNEDMPLIENQDCSLQGLITKYITIHPALNTFLGNLSLDSSIIERHSEIAEEIECIHLDPTNREALLQIASSAANQYGWPAFKRFNNGHIKDLETLIEVVKVFGNTCGWEKVIDFHEDDSIQEPLLVACLKLAIQNGEKLAENIKKYKIKDERDRIELAKLEATKGGGRSVLRAFTAYEISSLEAFMEISKIALNQDPKCGHFVFMQAKRHGFMHADFSEIAKIIAKKFGLYNDDKAVLQQKITTYGIKDQQTLIEIAKLSAAVNGPRLSHSIKSYNILDSKALFEIFLVALANSSNTLYSLWLWKNINTFEAGSVSDLYLIFREIDNAQNLSIVLQKLMVWLKGQGWKEAIGENVFRQIDAIHNQGNKKETLLWLTHFLGYCLIENLSYSQIATLRPLISCTVKFDPKVRYELTKAMICFAKNQENSEYPSISLSSSSSYTELVLLLLSLFYVQGMSKQACTTWFQRVARRFFKSGKESRAIVNGLSCLSQNTNITTKDIEYLLSLVIREEDDKNLTSIMSMIKAIHSFKEGAQLTKENLEKNQNDIKVIFESILYRYLPIKDNLMQHYVEVFGNARIPHYLGIYAATVHAHSDLAEKEQVMKTLVPCVEGKLTNAFLKQRYQFEEGSHLSMIFSNRPDLFTKWKTGSKDDLATFLDQDLKNESMIDFQKTLTEKILTAQHLDPIHVPFLMAHLNGSSSIEDKKELNRRFKESKKMSLEYLLLSLQINCIKLTSKIKREENKCIILKQQQHFLSEIVIRLEEISKTNKIDVEKFKKDISNLLNELEGKNINTKNYEKLCIVDTDDFEDLFLCGTEVEGCCQNINGSLDNECICLLAYVMDGKNRLLAIKNKRGNIIARQFLRILLDDKNNPVLFLEGPYPTNADPHLLHALERLAKKKSTGMKNLPLLSIKDTGKAYDFAIHSRGSPAPFEYCDALSPPNGQSTLGNYTIKKAYLL